MTSASLRCDHRRTSSLSLRPESNLPNYLIVYYDTCWPADLQPEVSSHIVNNRNFVVVNTHFTLTASAS